MLREKKTNANNLCYYLFLSLKFIWKKYVKEKYESIKVYILLQGDVRVVLSNGDFLIGHSIDNNLVGIQRRFNSKEKLMAVTDECGKLLVIHCLPYTRA